MARTRKASTQKRRVYKSELKAYIEGKFGDLTKASRAMGHNDDYLGSIFRKYNINIPEGYLDEIAVKLDIDMNQFLKKNTPKYDESQITFEELVSSAEDKAEELEMIEEPSKEEVDADKYTALVKYVDSIFGMAYSCGEMNKSLYHTISALFEMFMQFKRSTEDNINLIMNIITKEDEE